MILTRTSGYPTSEPISLETAKHHLRVDHNDDNALISGLITAAREYCEAFTGRCLATSQYVWYMNSFGYVPLILPYPPLKEISSVTYVDTGTSAVTTWSSAEYVVDTAGILGRLYPAYNYSWPNVRGFEKDIVITFLAGYGSTAQESRATPANVQIGDIFTLSVDGTLAATFTATAATVANVTAGLVAAWSCAGYTATNQTTYVKVVCDDLGIDFALTGTAVNGGADDTQTITIAMQTPAAQAIPKGIAQAMLLLIGNWYEHREATIVGTIIADVPMTVDMLLHPFKVTWF